MYDHRLVHASESIRPFDHVKWDDLQVILQRKGNHACPPLNKAMEHGPCVNALPVQSTWDDVAKVSYIGQNMIHFLYTKNFHMLCSCRIPHDTYDIYDIYRPTHLEIDPRNSNRKRLASCTPWPRSRSQDQKLWDLMIWCIKRRRLKAINPKPEVTFMMVKTLGYIWKKNVENHSKTIQNLQESLKNQFFKLWFSGKSLV